MKTPSEQYPIGPADAGEMGFVPGVMIATVAGALSVAPLSAVVHVAGPEIYRTEPYTFEEIGARWKRSVDTVERLLPSRIVMRLGTQKAVAPGKLLAFEASREGAER